MLSFNQQTELNDILQTAGFKPIESDQYRSVFISSYDGHTLEIKILTKLPQSFISIKMNGQTLLEQQPSSYKALKQLIAEFLDEHFKED